MSNIEQPQPHLHTVHDAITRAILASQDKAKLETATFKVHPKKKELAELICEKQGTTLSEFLRECVNGLCEDYVGQKTADKLEQEDK